MFKRRSLAALVLLGCFTTPVRAQTVDEIVGKFIAATGGAEKWRSVQSLTVASRSEAFSFDLYWKRPNRVRIEVPVEAPEPGLDIRAFDGTTGWCLTPLEGSEKPRLMSEQETLGLLEMGDAQRELIDYKKKGHRVELVGTEPVGGNPAHKLKLTKPSGAVVHVFIDAKSFLEVKRVIVARTPDGVTREVVTAVGDYRLVEGLLLPHRVGGAVREYRVNIPMDEAGFRMPGKEEEAGGSGGATGDENVGLTERVRDPERRAALLKENPGADVNNDGILTPEEAWAFLKKGEAARKLLPVGAVAPDWTLTDSRSRPRRLSDYRGKVVVMEFLAAWCIPCHRSMPWLEKLHADLSRRGVVVLGVSTWERGGDPARLMKDRGYTFGLLLRGETIAESYSVVGLPTLYVIGGDGRIIYSGFSTNAPAEERRRTLIENYLKQQGM